MACWPGERKLNSSFNLIGLRQIDLMSKLVLKYEGSLGMG